VTCPGITHRYLRVGCGPPRWRAVPVRFLVRKTSESGTIAPIERRYGPLSSRSKPDRPATPAVGSILPCPPSAVATYQLSIYGAGAACRIFLSPLASRQPLRDIEAATFRCRRTAAKSIRGTRRPAIEVRRRQTGLSRLTPRP
jgi:hypothetical protein